MLNKTEETLRRAREDPSFTLARGVAASLNEQMQRISINIHTVFPK